MIEATDRQWLRAKRYLADGHLQAAQIKLEALLLRDPGHVQTHILLGQVAWNQDRLRDATRHALDAAAQLPETTTDAAQVVEVATTLLQVGEVVSARSCLQHAALRDAEDAQLLVRLGLLREMLAEHSEALDMLDLAKSAGMDSPDFHFFRGVELTFNGRTREAATEFEACLSQAPQFGRAWLALARLQKQTTQDNHLQEIAQAIVGIPHTPAATESHAALEFAQYKELEDLGRYDEAWAALVRGNQLMYAKQPR